MPPEWLPMRSGGIEEREGRWRWEREGGGGEIGGKEREGGGGRGGLGGREREGEVGEREGERGTMKGKMGEGNDVLKEEKLN